MKEILFNPVLKWPWLAALTLIFLAALGASFFYGLRSRQRIIWLWGLRLSAFLALLILLLQPQRRHDESVVLRPQLAVLVDASESMTDPVDDRQPRRADRAQKWLASPMLEKARKDFDVRLFTFDRSLSEEVGKTSQIQFKGDRSNLIAALGQLQERFRGQPLAGILLLSDGLDPSASEQVQWPSSGVMVNTFELESPFVPQTHPRSLAIANVDYPRRTIVGRENEIHAVISATGLQGQTVTVELFRNGAKVAESAAAFNEDPQKREVSFAVSHEKAGVVQYELRAPDIVDSHKWQAYPFLIEVMEPGNRILYLQNTLGFDFKFLKKALIGDRNLQLSAYVRWPDNRLINLSEGGMSTGTALDLNQHLLSNCSVILLGDLPATALPPATWKVIRDFVDHGGGLVLLGGPNSLTSANLVQTPLGNLLPVHIGSGAAYQEGSFPVEITPVGMRHPVFGPLFTKVNEFPPLLTCNLSDGVAPNAEVLMQTHLAGKIHPLAASMRFGQGRVVALLTDTLWRWRLAAKGWTAERSPYETFWSQLMDWLLPKEQTHSNGNPLDLYTEQSNYVVGDHPEVCAILRDPSLGARPPSSLPLQVRTPDNKVFDYTLHPKTTAAGTERQDFTYASEVETFVDGVYRATCAFSLGGTNVTAETRFVAARPAGEKTGKPINRALLKKIAETSHGKFYALGEWDRWRKDLHYTEQHFERVRLQDLWNHPLLSGFMIMLLCMEWFLRKQWNLP